jgi:hypothetical protein
MAKMIQVRNVTDRTHRELVRRAKARNQTLTAFIEELLEREVARPTREEVFARIGSREPIALDISAADLIQAEREERERHLHSLLTRRRSASTS